MDEMYRENMLDHHKNPRHQGKPSEYNFSYDDKNPLCGDQVEIFGLIKDGVLKDVGFEGKGCIICMSSTSILLEEVYGKSKEELDKFSKEDLFDLIGVSLTPSRVKCAMLPFVCLKKGLLSYEGGKK